MSRIPVELYREIVQHVPIQRDLAVLSRTCRMLQQEAEVFLYRSMRLTCQEETLAFCALLGQSPRFRPLIHSLSITNDTLSFLPPDGYWRGIAATLVCLCNLTVLRITDSLDKDNAWIFAQCPFSLRELECDFVLDAAFISFLRTQSRLETFRWMYSLPDPWVNAISDVPAEPDFLPALRTLATNSRELALKLLPAHALAHLCVEGLSGLWATDAERLVLMEQVVVHASTLKELRVTFPREKALLLRALEVLAAQVPNLTSLGYVTAFTSQDTEILTELSRLKQLESIVMLCPLEVETMRALADACPTLRNLSSIRYTYSEEFLLRTFPAPSPTTAPSPSLC